MHTPVLLIVFNRPHTTREVFRAIREAAPNKLYIAADGPRPERKGERALCGTVREIVTDVDWHCEVTTRLMERNLGCRVGPASAISWFFQYEEEGIILEDDVVPSQSFFRFASEALSKYRASRRIWQISGNNFDAPSAYFGTDEVRTVSLGQVWGWATWRNRWSAFEENPWLIRANSGVWRMSRVARLRKETQLEYLRKGLDAWDYQWHIAMLNHGGETLIPAANLVTNIGSGESATHTRRTDARLHLQRTEHFSYSLPDVPVYGNALNRYFERRMGLWRLGRQDFVVRMRKGWVGLRTKSERLLARSLLPDTRPVVVASTGRAGSTVLGDAISEAWASENLPSPFRFLTRFGRGWCNDLDEANTLGQPLLKSHAFPPHAIETSHELQMIFLFADPVESLFSVLSAKESLGQAWFDEHQMHLCGQGSIAEIFERDVLGYCEQIYRWLDYRDRGGRVLIVDYDQLWQDLPRVESFLGLPISLPLRRQRRSSGNAEVISASLLRDLRNAYDFAREKLAKEPNTKVRMLSHQHL